MRREIERTRDEMSGTIDAIADRTVPSRIVHRQKARFSDRLHNVRSAVMGSAEDAYVSTQERARGFAGGAHDAVAGAGANIGGTVSQIGDQVGNVGQGIAHAPQAMRQQAQGNPLAAGLIAFGVGALAASVMPSTRFERQAVDHLKDQAEPVLQELKSAGQELAEGVQGTAQEAAQEVKATATDAVQQLTGEAKDAAQQVSGEARDTAQEVKQQAQTAAEHVTGSAPSGDSTSPTPAATRPTISTI